MDNMDTEFRPFPSYQDNGDDTPLEDGRPVRHFASEHSTTLARWSHITDLDTFFKRIYQYHQKHGFKCMMAQEVADLMQFVFAVVFGMFLLQCVDYKILFGETNVHNSTSKVTFLDAFLPWDEYFFYYKLLIPPFVIACIMFVWKMARIAYNFYLYLDIRDFYSVALKIREDEIDNFTWNEVQHRLQMVQPELKISIQRQELTELDIYHRILRHKNYMVAMINKEILPVKYNLPFMGEIVFFTTGIKWNYEKLLLGAFTNWELKDDYKLLERRSETAKALARKTRYLGLINFVLAPIIFTWLILYSVLTYAELIRRRPSVFGTRYWSQYGRLYLRHFNELDHELDARLNRGYRPATKYMSIFSSPMSAIIARTVQFICGALLSVLVVATIYDESILHVEHAVTVVTVLGGIVVVANTFLPNENLVFCPEKIFLAVLAQIHYMPQHWYGKTHTMKVKNEFGQLFQFVSSFLMSEILSPLICPLILMFVLPKHAEKVVDFYRNFTVSVVGVGDVCSFAQMDIRKHGNPQWLSHGQKQNMGFQAKDGKTELSLMHFTLTNPDWKPPTESSAFITNLRHRATRDANNLGMLQEENPFYYSLYSLSSLGPEYSSLVGSLMQNNMTQSIGPCGPLNTVKPVLRGALTNVEGPVYGSMTGLLSSVQTASCGGSGGDLVSLQPPSLPMPFYDNLRAELQTADMSFSALYMHQLHRTEIQQENQTDQAELSHVAVRTLGNPQREMQHIQEEEHNETTPLVDFTGERYT